jgi:hypothetical protein
MARPFIPRKLYLELPEIGNLEAIDNTVLARR